MLLPDVNVLLYAVDQTSQFHRASSNWLEGALNSNEAVGFAWSVILAFLRLGTNPRISVRPLEPGEALDYVEEWCAAGESVILQPGPGHLTILRSLLIASGMAGNLTSDAHLAALAIEYNATLVSYDSDFLRFPSLKLHKPTL